jgi:lysine biosynthesis protein LysW
VETAVVYCPECDAKIELQEVKMGEIVECLACGSYLKIVGTYPAELEFDEEDDWLGNDTK